MRKKVFFGAVNLLMMIHMKLKYLKLSVTNLERQNERQYWKLSVRLENIKL